MVQRSSGAAAWVVPVGEVCELLPMHGFLNSRRRVVLGVCTVGVAALMTGAPAAHAASPMSVGVHVVRDAPAPVEAAAAEEGTPAESSDAPPVLPVEAAPTPEAESEPALRWACSNAVRNHSEW